MTFVIDARDNLEIEMLTLMAHYYMSPTERIKQLMRDRQLTQLMLADMTGISQSGLNRFLNGSRQLKMEIINRLSGALKTTPEYIMFGVDRGIAPALQISVPVLPVDKIDTWINTPESMTSADSDWIGCPIDIAGPKTFAYRVVTDDMAGPFVVNSLVFIDPEKELEPGANALFSLANGSTVFRQFQSIAGDHVLKPINSAYPPIMAKPEETKYLGTALGALVI